MLMMEYGSQYTGSTLGTDTLSGSVGSRQNRVRTVRLVRPNHSALPPPGLTCKHGPNLGFSIRGGREHGTGIFVSHVEMGSEAHRQGLRVGDQIIRVNGFTVEDAVHKEVIQLISNHTHLSLKVRSVGMIPVKDKKHDSLSWQIISDCNSSTRSSPQLSEKSNDVKISLSVAPRAKLGCGICKGPDWKPGIFIQFTKENGIAREAGLRPGDQIMYCNGVDFSDIPFNEAVTLMKGSRILELSVRKAAGSELFPGESSGYNSSASSVTGDQSPSWSESKRLSIVKEESLELEDRLCNLERFKCKKWEKIEWDDMENEDKCQYKPTIINLSENGMTIKNNCSYEDYQEIEKNVCLISEHHETKTVVVEVHRSIEDDKFTKTEPRLCKSPSASSFASIASRSSAQSATTSLSSAISQELLRRSEKNKNYTKPTIDEQLQFKKTLKGTESVKQEQHIKLMDEFKKVHRKMFNNSDLYEEDLEDEEEKDRNYNTKELKSFEEAPEEQSSTPSRHSAPPILSAPPPPPPLPQSENQLQEKSNTLARSKQKAPPPPVPIKTSTLSFHQPPPCPTPDYDTLSIASSNSTLPRNYNNNKKNNETSQSINDSVEMESLDSFKIQNPANNIPIPRAPNHYFNGSLPRKGRPVSVTIGEYPSGTNRKLPGKFNFLQNGSDELGRKKEESLNSQLASELQQTLSRSNLRRRTESSENIFNNCQVKNETNGSVRISLNNGLNKSSSHIEALTKMLENRVTISIAGNEKKNDAPSGILKNTNGLQ